MILLYNRLYLSSDNTPLVLRTKWRRAKVQTVKFVGLWNIQLMSVPPVSHFDKTIFKNSELSVSLLHIGTTCILLTTKEL